MIDKGRVVDPRWLDWAVRDEDGFMNGVRDDAPDDVKEAYQKYLQSRWMVLKRGEAEDHA